MLAELLTADERHAAKAEMLERRAALSPSLPFLPWTERHRALLAPGHPFSLAGKPYLEALYNETHADVVVEKAAQTGASELLVGWSLYHLDLGHHVLYVLPTEDDVSDFSASRIGPAIEASPYLSRRVVTGAERGADRVTLKRIGSAFLFLRGGKVKSGPATGGEERAGQLKSMRADCTVMDEYDEIDARADAFVEQRMAASSIRLRRRVSTPTYAGSGIHPLYMASDQMTWHVRCEACGLRQPLTLANLVREWDDLERPTVWNKDDDGAPALHCSKCASVLDRTAAGEWVAAHPDRPLRGYHLSRLFVADRPLQEIIDGLRETDDSKRKQTYNQALGLPYTARGSKSLTDEILDACRRDYAPGPRPGGAFCGIDVGRVLHVVIRGADWSLRAAFEHNNFDRDLTDRLREHGVLVTTVDANPETREARAFQASQANQTWLAYYVQGRADLNEEPMLWNDDRGSGKWGTVKTDRTRAMDGALALFHVGAKREPGGATLPANFSAQNNPDYYAHLKAPQRVKVKDATGNEVAVYQQTGADHFAHAEVYAYMSAARWLYQHDHTTYVQYNPLKIGAY